MFLMCCSTSLDQQTTNNLGSFATSSFGTHSLLSTVLVIHNILNAVMQPPIAKAADVFGRTEAFTAALAFYIIGMVLTASSNSIGLYTFAKIFDAAGNTSLRMLQQVFIADTSDLMNRALMSSVPDIPFLATVWIGPVIGGPLGKSGQWRWGFGMWYTHFLPGPKGSFADNVKGCHNPHSLDPAVLVAMDKQPQGQEDGASTCLPVGREGILGGYKEPSGRA